MSGHSSSIDDGPHGTGKKTWVMYGYRNEPVIHSAFTGDDRFRQAASFLIVLYVFRVVLFFFEIQRVLSSEFGVAFLIGTLIKQYLEILLVPYFEMESALGTHPENPVQIFLE